MKENLIQLDKNEYYSLEEIKGKINIENINQLRVELLKNKKIQKYFLVWFVFVV